MKITANNETSKIVLFSLDEPRYALHLYSVERVIHAVSITPLPNSLEKVMGIVNVQGEIIPVIDIRKIFHLTSHEICVDDQFIIAKTSKRRVVLVVDEVIGVSELLNHKIKDPEKTLPFAEYLNGISIFENNIILITDLEKFLSLEEEMLLDQAMKEAE